LGAAVSETKWTPGPWEVIDDYWIVGPDGGIAEAFHNLYDGTEAANAHLIASAPDLYEALSMARDRLSELQGGEDAITQSVIGLADCVMRQARGEQ